MAHTWDDYAPIMCLCITLTVIKALLNCQASSYLCTAERKKDADDISKRKMFFTKKRKCNVNPFLLSHIQ